MKKFVSYIWDWVRDRVQKNPRVLAVLFLAFVELFVLFLIWCGFACWFWFDWICSLFVGFRDFLKVIFKNATLAAALFSAPIAFLIWAFRNHDKQREIKNKEDELNQKDEQHSLDLDAKTFNQLQQWACDTDNPDLQVVAINQLCPYVLGEHGERFKRPTFILLKTLWFNLVKEHLGKFDASFSSINISDIREQVEKQLDIYDQPAAETIRNILQIGKRSTCFQELRSVTSTPLAQALNYALLQRHGKVFRDNVKDLPSAVFAGLNFTLPNLDQPIDLSGLDMRGIDFRAINNSNTRPNILLQNSLLQGAQLSFSNLENTQLQQASLFATNFHCSNLSGADLSGATCFEDCSLVSFSDANLENVTFNSHLDPAMLPTGLNTVKGYMKSSNPARMWSFKRAGFTL